MSGKTRLALEAAARRIDRYPHGVHFVPLVSVSRRRTCSRPRSPRAIQFAGRRRAQRLLGAGPAARLPARAVHAARARQLRAPASTRADLLSEVIERAPHVELLTTSRERLNVQSEWVLDVDGLGRTGTGTGTRRQRGSAPVRRSRASGRRRASRSTTSERPHVERICRLVTGCRSASSSPPPGCPTLPCSEIADEIERNLDFLATSMRDVPERHRSLRAAFDQSWRLLSDDERRVFSRLVGLPRHLRAGCRGRGGRTPVCACSHELVSKSLVRRAGLRPLRAARAAAAVRGRAAGS